MKLHRMFINALWWTQTVFIFVLFLPLLVIVVLSDAIYYISDAFMDVAQDIGEACLDLFHKVLKHRIKREAGDATKG